MLVSKILRKKNNFHLLSYIITNNTLNSVQWYEIDMYIITIPLCYNVNNTFMI